MAQSANNEKQLKGWDKIVAWYASKAYTVNIVYSLGASVVIIGALFKILHWPGASYVLMLGMFTEAFLFCIGIFEKPHAVYHWENVYPQLLGDEVKEVLGGAGAGAAAGANVNAAADASALEEKDVKALKDGIANVAAAANQLADLGKLAEGTQALSGKLAAAATSADKLVGAQDAYATATSAAADKFAGAQDAIVANAAAAATAVQALGANYNAAAQSIAPVAASNEAVAKASAAVAQNLASINAAYELQLKAAQEAQKNADAYAAAQAKLAAQVADLNKVYGNMLSAL